MMEEVSNSVAGLFGLDIKNVAPGHKALAVGLVVSGNRESVQLNDDGLDEVTLAEGLQKVTKEGNQAVGEAQKSAVQAHDGRQEVSHDHLAHPDA